MRFVVVLARVGAWLAAGIAALATAGFVWLAATGDDGWGGLAFAMAALPAAAAVLLLGVFPPRPSTGGPSGGATSPACRWRRPRSPSSSPKPSFSHPSPTGGSDPGRPTGCPAQAGRRTGCRPFVVAPWRASGGRGRLAAWDAAT